MPLREKPPSTLPMLGCVIATAAVGLLWVYAGTRNKSLFTQIPAIAPADATPALGRATAVAREFCETMRRDIANDAVEFDPESTLDAAIVKAWDADCRSQHDIAILK